MSKKPFKLNILGLIKLETEINQALSFRQVAVLVCLFLLVFAALAFLLKVYLLPLLFAQPAGWFVCWIGRLFKSKTT
jgi:hypothetical protein